jgi:hypothetical protein
MLCPKAVEMSVLKAVFVKKWDGERGHACGDSSGIIVSRLAEDVFLCVSSQVTMLFLFLCFPLPVLPLLSFLAFDLHLFAKRFCRCHNTG